MGLRVDPVVGIADGIQEGAAVGVTVGLRVGSVVGIVDGIVEGEGVYLITMAPFPPGGSIEPFVTPTFPSNT